jgi:hypothetical protein
MLMLMLMLILVLMLGGVCSAPETSRFGGAFLVSIGLLCLFHYLLERKKTRLREKEQTEMGMKQREREVLILLSVETVVIVQ